jgi:SAM-dependent methyltransferase
MQTNSVVLEEERLLGTGTEEKPLIRERHRVFPAVFEKRNHQRIIDVAAGVGYVAKRIRDNYAGQMYCNDLSPTCLKNLRKLEIPVVSYTLDSMDSGFPFANDSFDAVIALATIEHILQVDAFVREIYRILAPDGCFYLSAPNYASVNYLFPMIFNGRTFHDPLNAVSRYEFYAHVRYFTYRTLMEYIPTFGFVPEAVYLPVPKSSSNYVSLSRKSKLMAWGFKGCMSLLYRISPRWASEPIICFRKAPASRLPFRKILL